jgi:deoxyribonuclease IV
MSAPMLAGMLIGAHVPNADPLAEAAARDADCVQFFLSNPQSWRKPTPREDAEALRTAGLPVYVHAPYLVNVASANNRIRIPSRKILQDTCDAATAVGATAVIVHGGHVDSDTDLDTGIDNWRKALERLETDVPVLIENTAGGDHAMSRQIEAIARLWDVVGPLGAGFCFDTCHAHAAGEDVAGGAERLRAIVGRIDLVHCNDSKDEPGTGRDRHEHLGQGRIEPEALVEAVRVAQAPVVCETPGPAEAQAEDLAWLRSRVT